MLGKQKRPGGRCRGLAANQPPMGVQQLPQAYSNPFDYARGFPLMDHACSSRTACHARSFVLHLRERNADALLVTAAGMVNLERRLT